MFDRSYISNTGSTGTLPAERPGRPVPIDRYRSTPNRFTAHRTTPYRTDQNRRPSTGAPRRGRDMTAVQFPAAAPRLRITPRGRAVVAVLVAAPLALGAVALGLGQGAAASTSSSSSTSAATFHWITVGHGDSLWSIAQRIAPSADPRDVIADIVDLNQLPSASVSAGERIAIPDRYTR